MKKIILIICFLILLIQVGCNKNDYDFGKGYYLGYNSQNDIALLGPFDRFIVYGQVVKFSFNHKFIIIKEMPRENNYISDGELITIEYPQNFDNSIKKKYYQYWILDKLIDSLYGPFQKKEFYQKLKELRVPDSLKKMKNIKT